MFFNKLINMNYYDRVIRLGLAIIFFIIAFFWVYGGLEFVFYFLGFLFLINSFTGVSELYCIFKLSTCKPKQKYPSGFKRFLIVLILLAILFLGILLSILLTNKIFLNDFEKFNSSYKQTLYYLENNDKSKANDNFAIFKINFKEFNKKYSNYKPYIIKSDTEFNRDMEKINTIIEESDEYFKGTNLTLAHQELIKIDPILKDIMSRIGFSEEA